MINIIATEQIDTEKQWVFITLEVGGETIEHTTVQPWNTKDPLLEGRVLTDWCNSQEDRYRFEILKGMYPDAKENTASSLEAWVKDNDKVEKKEWINKHPKRIGLKKLIQEAKTIGDLKLILMDMVS